MILFLLLGRDNLRPITENSILSDLLPTESTTERPHFAHFQNGQNAHFQNINHHHHNSEILKRPPTTLHPAELNKKQPKQVQRLRFQNKKHKNEFPLPPMPLKPDPLLHHSNAITSAAPTGKMTLKNHQIWQKFGIN